MHGRWWHLVDNMLHSDPYIDSCTHSICIYIYTMMKIEHTDSVV